jgi:tRNA pseudouridine55 synthase
VRPPSAIWLYRKEAGVTSTSVVEAFRAAHAGPWPLKASHGGVLDPFAYGLVVVLGGAANKLFEALHEAPKRYVARVAWGVETETGDAQGREVSRCDARALEPSRLDKALAPFLGWTRQVPPATSNKRVGGERAYRLAHRGEEVVLPAQDVYCHEARWLAHELPAHSTLELVVRGGFYVRSLARDLGRALGVGAHLVELERSHLGPWTHGPQPRQLRGREVLPWLPSVELSDAAWGALRASERVGDVASGDGTHEEGQAAEAGAAHRADRADRAAARGWRAGGDAGAAGRAVAEGRGDALAEGREGCEGSGEGREAKRDDGPSRRAQPGPEVALRKLEGVVGPCVVSRPAWAVPEGFPSPSGVRCFHQGRLVALQRDRLVLLPGGV